MTDVRRDGYSIDDEECIEGVFCVGTAIANRRDQSNTLGLSVALLKQHASEKLVLKPVSYTHLDVYKRQAGDKIGP